MTFFLEKTLFEQDEFIKITGAQGMKKINAKLIRILSINYGNEKGPHEAVLDISTIDEPKFDPNSYATFELAFEPKLVKFNSFKSESEPKKIVKLNNYINDNKFSLANDLHLIFCEMLSYYETHHQFPNDWDGMDLPGINMQLFMSIVKYYNYELAPMSSFIASLITNEVLKVGGKYSPIQQWLHYSLIHCDISNFGTQQDQEIEVHNENIIQLDSRYIYLEKLVSKKSQETIANLKVFLVGAGAIGCEYLRQFISLGFGTGTNGKIYLVDHDKVSISNLNRQFFFREDDIGKNKAIVAAQKVRAINPDIKIEAHDRFIKDENRPPFNQKFWENLDMIIVAVDNVESRFCLFEKACQYEKVMFDAGTNGIECSHDPYIPHYSSEYNSTQSSQPQEQLPCTLRESPYKIGHILLYARELFEKKFKSEILKIKKTAQGLLETQSRDSDFVRLDMNPIDDNQARAIQTLQQYADLSPEDFCLKKAFELFNETFISEIDNILRLHPSNHQVDGEAYWKPPRRLPRPLEYDVNDPLHRTFIISAANIYSHIFFKGDIKFDHEDKLVGNLTKDRTEEPVSSNISIEKVKNIQEFVQPKEFEKDQDDLMDIDFVYSLTTLRARVYNIEPTDKETVRTILGNITPSTIISTSLIVSLSMFEIIKSIQGLPIDYFRSSRNNLASPSIDFYKIREVTNPSPWEYIIVNGSCQETLEDLVNNMERDYGQDLGKVMSIDHNGKTIYKLSEEPILPMNTKIVDLENFDGEVKYIFLFISFYDLKTKKAKSMQVKYSV